MPAEPIIKIENVSLVYDMGKSNETWGLRDINLEIYPQEYVIFFGPSGCGKSTLLYTIAGLLRPSQGKILVNGRDLVTLAKNEIVDFHRATIGMVFQAYYLIPYLSVKENILLPRFFLNEPVSERRKKADTLIERFGLGQVMDRKANMLSGGQQQRVAIARSLINSPSIILADEPVGNLDSKNAEIVLDLIANLNKEDKKTVIHITHDPRHLTVADRVFHMQDGRLTKVTVNRDKSGAAAPAEPQVSDYDRMSQLFPSLAESEIKSKLIANYLLLPYDFDVWSRIEGIINSYLLKQIDESTLSQILDKPLEKGGAGLYLHKAEELTRNIVNIVSGMNAWQEVQPALNESKKKIAAIRAYLLDGYKGQLTLEQIERIERGIALRLAEEFGKNEVRQLFDVSLENGGAGLNRQTARRFSEELELLIAKKKT